MIDADTVNTGGLCGSMTTQRSLQCTHSTVTYISNQTSSTPPQLQPNSSYVPRTKSARGQPNAEVCDVIQSPSSPKLTASAVNHMQISAKLSRNNIWICNGPTGKAGTECRSRSDARSLEIEYSRVYSECTIPK